MQKEERLIKIIKEKKSLSGVTNSVIKKELENYLKDKKINISYLNAKDEKIIVKDIREKLRRLTGSFQYKEESENPLLLHTSTKERIDFYPELKAKIAIIKPKSILDLGSGINPIALASKEAYYYAYDINEKDLDIVRDFFEKNKIVGETKISDLRDPEIKLPEVDLCIMFKILDILDQKNHKLSESLIKKIKARYFIISFSTKTLSGAPMRHPQRGWIELLLNRLGFNFESFSSKNEIFYLAYK